MAEIEWGDEYEVSDKPDPHGRWVLKRDGVVIGTYATPKDRDEAQRRDFDARRLQKRKDAIPRHLLHCKTTEKDCELIEVRGKDALECIYCDAKFYFQAGRYVSWKEGRDNR